MSIDPNEYNEEWRDAKLSGGGEGFRDNCQ